MRAIFVMKKTEMIYAQARTHTHPYAHTHQARTCRGTRRSHGRCRRTRRYRRRILGSGPACRMREAGSTRPGHLTAERYTRLCVTVSAGVFIKALDSRRTSTILWCAVYAIFLISGACCHICLATPVLTRLRLGHFERKRPSLKCSKLLFHTFPSRFHKRKQMPVLPVACTRAHLVSIVR